MPLEGKVVDRPYWCWGEVHLRRTQEPLRQVSVAPTILLRMVTPRGTKEFCGCDGIYIATCRPTRAVADLQRTVGAVGAIHSPPRTHGHYFRGLADVTRHGLL